jgi:NAD(P)H-hydrate epimerase
MQRIDDAAIRTFGIPRLLLMEHAGMGLAVWTHRLYRRSLGGAPRATQAVVVCCGPGHNGGDGLAAARHLHAWGHTVRVLLAGPRGALREEPAVYAVMAGRLGIPVRSAAGAPGLRTARRWFSGCGVIVDALLGIGARGAVRPDMAALIRLMNAARRPIVAADVPSGLDAEAGRPRGETVRARLTVSFGAAKRGLLTARARPYVGRLVVAPITIPREAFARA